MLIRHTRQTQRLAQLQMNFVTGVSYELRAPLTVIRTAAYIPRNSEFHRRACPFARGLKRGSI
jgi:signal transduction histidine kinase